MSKPANKVLGVTYIIGNDVKGDIATLLLHTCQEALKRNVDKKFMNPTYPHSDIPIPGEWTLATGYDVKSGPTWLDKGMGFSNVKELLEGIYSDVKKGTRFVVWLGFRMPDDETLNVREESISTSVPSTPLQQATAKPSSKSQEVTIKREPGVSNRRRKIKQEKLDTKPNVRKVPLALLNTFINNQGKRHTKEQHLKWIHQAPRLLPKNGKSRLALVLAGK
jgi:hypothetical protein